MRKIINSTYVSLDGLVGDPHLWPSLGRPGDERGDQIQTDLLMACDAVLMGRRTYEGFAPVWQTRSGDPFSDRINTMPKYVVSTTLTDPDWPNTTVIEADVAARIAALKEEPGQDIVQYGYGPVSRLMLEHDLLDELRLWIHPLIVGSEHDMLFGTAPAVGFELADVTQLSNGIAILAYRFDKRL
jgi:dihydrofolate reductase